MLVNPSIEELLPNADCAYELAVLVSKRARQLVEGGQPMVGDKAANMVSLACKEIAAGKVVRVKGDRLNEITIPKTKAARDAELAAQLAREEAERARELERAMQYENNVVKEAEDSQETPVFNMVEIDSDFDSDEVQYEDQDNGEEFSEEAEESEVAEETEDLEAAEGEDL